jgi:hypothetical protein
MNMNAVLEGCVLFKNKEIVIFAFEPAGRPSESVFRVLVDSNWHVYNLESKWTVVGMGCARYPNSDDWVIVASSSEGDLWELRPGTPLMQELKIVGDYSGLTGLAGIEGAVWACGMDRIVLRRELDGTWADLSAPPATLEEGVIGFTALAGSAPGEIVAVGWKGEIWLRRNDKWDVQDSGTNANFNAVSVAPDGQVVVVGDDGAIVVGRRNQWSALDVGVDFNLQGVCHFGSEVFVCSDFELFRFEKGALVTETRFDDEDVPETCMNLIAGTESVFSQGERDIFRYVKGLWTRIF